MTDGVSLVRQYAVVRPAGPAPITKTSASVVMRGAIPRGLGPHLRRTSLTGLLALAEATLEALMKRQCACAIYRAITSADMRFSQNRRLLCPVRQIGQAPSKFFRHFIQRPESGGSLIGESKVVVKMKNQTMFDVVRAELQHIHSCGVSITVDVHQQRGAGGRIFDFPAGS